MFSKVLCGGWGQSIYVWERKFHSLEPKHEKTLPLIAHVGQCFLYSIFTFVMLVFRCDIFFIYFRGSNKADGRWIPQPASLDTVSQHLDHLKGANSTMGPLSPELPNIPQSLLIKGRSRGGLSFSEDSSPEMDNDIQVCSAALFFLYFYSLSLSLSVHL